MPLPCRIAIFSASAVFGLRFRRKNLRRTSGHTCGTSTCAASSSQESRNADLPALPAELFAIFENQAVRGVLDIGGDPVGARVLARFRPKILAEDHQLIYVLNANRPEVRDSDAAIAYLRSIEAVTGLTCTGIVNNTHLCGETTADDVRKGAALAQAVSQETGIPVVCHVAHEALAAELEDLSPLFPITIRMKKPWE